MGKIEKSSEENPAGWDTFGSKTQATDQAQNFPLCSKSSSGKNV
jgi:hypothetical protein